jgi:hypothetical protein
MDEIAEGGLGGQLLNALIGVGGTAATASAQAGGFDVGFIKQAVAKYAGHPTVAPPVNVPQGAFPALKVASM